MRKTRLMVGRVIALCLAFVLGFFSAFGAIAGGIYFAFAGLSIDKINQWGEMFGVNIPVDQYVDKEADKPITSLTLQDLILEIQELTKATLTLEQMVERYGLILPPDVIDKVPETLMSEIPFTALFTPEGVDAMMKTVTVADVMAMIPEDIAGTIVSDPLRDAMSDRTLSDVVEMNLGHIFDGVQLGYLAGVTYVLDENGEYQPVWEDLQNPTIIELVAPLDLGGILAAVSNDEGNVLEVIANSIGDVTINSLLGTFAADIALINNLLGDATLGNLLVPNPETGEYEFNIMLVMEGKKLGTVLGYVQEEVIDPETLETGYVWKDADGNDIVGVNAILSDIGIDNLMNGKLDVNDMVNTLTIGQMLGYVEGEELPVYIYSDLENPIILDNVPTVWYQGDKMVDKMMGALAGKNFTWITTSISDLMLSDILGYCEYNGAWYMWEVKEVNGSNAIVLNPGDTIMSEVVGTSISGLANVGETFRDIQIAKLLGYAPEYTVDENGNEVIEYWKDANGEKVTGVIATIADLTVAQLSESGTLQGKIDSLMIADVLGYTAKYKVDEDGNYVLDANGNKIVESWKDSNGDAVTGPMAAMAGSTIGGLSSNINIMKLGELLGYRTETREDKNGNKETYWVGSDEKEVTGVMATFAGLTINDLSNGNTLQSTINGMTIADVLGYTANYKVDEDGNYIIDANGDKIIESWKDSNGALVTGPMAAMAGSTIGGLSSHINTMKLGELLGYKTETRTENGKEVIYWIGSDNKEVTGVMATFAGLTINDLSNGNILQSTINGMTIADVLGYTANYKVDEDGNYIIDANGDKIIESWKDSNGALVTGPMAAMAGSTVGSLSTDINKMELGSLLGYESICDEDGNHLYWSTKRDENGNPVKATGVMATFAGLTMEDLSAGDTLQKTIDGMYIADVLGYTKGEGDKWYKGETVVTGPMAAMADSTVGSLSSDLNKMKLGKLLGYTEGKDGTWVDKYNKPVTGVMSAFVDFTMDDMADGASIQKKIDDMSIADVLGYTANYKVDEDGNYVLDANGNKIVESWKDSNGAAVTGPMAAMAGSKVKNLSSDLNEMAIGKMLGYTSTTETVDGKEVTVWKDESGKNVDGLMSAFVDLSIKDMKDSGKLQSSVQDIKIKDVMGLYEENGVWYNSNGTPATGVMVALADTEVKNISTKMNTITIAQLLDLKKENGVWYNSDGSKTSSIIAALADAPANDLTGKLNTMKLGVILNYEYLEANDANATSGAGWYVYDKTTQKYTKATGVTGALADSDLQNLDGKLKTLQVGEVAGYTYNEKNSTWYTADGKEATGVLAELSDLTVDDLTKEKALTEKIGNVKLADALGYTYNEGEDAWYDGETKLTGIMAALADKPINKMGTAVNDLTLDQIIPGEKTGLLSIIPGNTKINEIDKAIDNSLMSTPIQFFIDKGIITLDSTTINTLDAICYVQENKVNNGTYLIPIGNINDTYKENYKTSYTIKVTVYGLAGTVTVENVVPSWRTQPLQNSFGYIVNLMSVQ